MAAARVHEAHGRVARLGGNVVLLQNATGEDRSLPPGARRNDLWQARVLCIGHRARRIRRGRSGRDEHGTSDQDRRQSSAPGEPRRDGYLCAGLRARAMGSGPVEDGPARPVDRDLGTLSRRLAVEAPRPARRPGLEHPHRNSDIADAARAIARRARQVSARAVAPLSAAQPRQRL